MAVSGRYIACNIVPHRKWKGGSVTGTAEQLRYQRLICGSSPAVDRSDFLHLIEIRGVLRAVQHRRRVGQVQGGRQKRKRLDVSKLHECCNLSGYCRLPQTGQRRRQVRNIRLLGTIAGAPIQNGPRDFLADRGTLNSSPRVDLREPTL